MRKLWLNTEHLSDVTASMFPVPKSKKNCHFQKNLQLKITTGKFHKKYDEIFQYLQNIFKDIYKLTMNFWHEKRSVKCTTFFECYMIPAALQKIAVFKKFSSPKWLFKNFI